MLYEVDGKKGKERPKINWRRTWASSGKRERMQKIVKNGEKCLGTQSANPCSSRENRRKMRRNNNNIKKHEGTMRLGEDKTSSKLNSHRSN